MTVGPGLAGGCARMTGPVGVTFCGLVEDGKLGATGLSPSLFLSTPIAVITSVTNPSDNTALLYRVFFFASIISFIWASKALLVFSALETMPVSFIVIRCSNQLNRLILESPVLSQQPSYFFAAAFRLLGAVSTIGHSAPNQPQNFFLGFSGRGHNCLTSLMNSSSCPSLPNSLQASSTSHRPCASAIFARASCTRSTEIRIHSQSLLVFASSHWRAKSASVSRFRLLIFSSKLVFSSSIS